MVIGRHCTFSLTRSGREQFESFVWNTGIHVVVAGAVNGVFLYLMGKEDLLPGILVGASAGFAQNITHKTAHVLTSRGREKCHLSYAMEVIIAAALTYGIACGLLRAFEYDFGKGEVLKLQTVGMISIAFYNYHQKGQGKG
jgi:hypothetical protein